MRPFLFLLSVFVLQISLIQGQNQTSSSEILLGIQKLNHLGRILYVAAHPDDENTRLLAYLASEKKFRTAYLSLTRGDGGQNLVGKEQGPGLGVIRTQELLAARKVDGAEQFFSSAVDFGYSKNPEETFRFWNKEKILSDVVYIIRKFRPDVIICRFPTTGEGGHGHHTASAIIAQEALEAAADPLRFPEQLSTLKPWACPQLFWNTFNFSGGNTTSPDQLQVDVGGYNPLLGKSYGEIASESRSCHKSQGFGVPRQRGKNVEYFKQIKGETAVKDPFERIEQSWKSLPGTEILQDELNKCIQSYKAEQPWLSVPSLVKIHKSIETLDTNNAELKYYRDQKLPELEELILKASGLWLEATAADFQVIPGQDFAFKTQMILRSPVSVTLRALHYPGSDTISALALQDNQLYTFSRTEKLSSYTPYSSPFWLNKTGDGFRGGQAQNPAPASVWFDLQIEGLFFSIQRPIVYKFTDPVKGEIYRPLEVLPQATINFKEPSYVFTNGEAREVFFTLKTNVANLRGKMQFQSTDGFQALCDKPDIQLNTIGDEVQVAVKVTCSAGVKTGYLKASFSSGDEILDQGIQRIEYDHIPSQFILSESKVKLVNVPLKTKRLHIAYIEGAGDGVVAAMRQIGYDIDVFKASELPKTKLAGYDAIVTGIRAYNTDKELLQYNSILFDYVKLGGNLLVQYNTNSNIGQLKSQIGPYPFTISRERVTDETAEVRFLLPKHPALIKPNLIDSNDFGSWIQERGIYFATEVDAHYVSPLGMNDMGQKEQTGSLIIAPYGKGNYIYTGLVFFRELPAGVPGAYRLFVNLLNLPRH